MLRIPHVALISTAAGFGIFFLWLQRIYHGTPLLGELAVPAADSILGSAAFFVSAITSPAAVLAFGIAGILFAVYEHHVRLWWLFIGLTAVSITASAGLKGIIMIDRPAYRLIELSSYGFPSTHATLATVLFIVVSWFVYYWEHRYRLYIALVSGVGWLIVGLSRILLGVHNVSDVLAGIMLGAAVGSLAIWAGPKLFSYFRITSTATD